MEKRRQFKLFVRDTMKEAGFKTRIISSYVLGLQSSIKSPGTPAIRYMGHRHDDGSYDFEVLYGALASAIEQPLIDNWLLEPRPFAWPCLSICTRIKKGDQAIDDDYFRDNVRNYIRQLAERSERSERFEKADIIRELQKAADADWTRAFAGDPLFPPELCARIVVARDLWGADLPPNPDLMRRIKTKPAFAIPRFELAFVDFLEWWRDNRDAYAQKN